MSLGNRLSLYIALLVIAIFCAIGAIVFRYGAQREERLMSLYAALMVENSGERLNSEFAQVEEHLRASAPFAVSLLRRPEALPDFVDRMVLDDSLIMGACVALRPGIFPQRPDSLWMEYAAFDLTGKLRHKHISDSSSYIYTSMSWYSDAVDAHRPIWSDPYFDKGAGNQMMVTCTFPLRDSDDNFLGVITADISLRALSEEIRRLRPIDDSYAFILNGKGFFVAHPDSSLILHKSIFDISRDTGCRHLSSIGEEMLALKKGTRHIDVAGEDALVVYQPVADTGWSICSVCPYKSVMEQLDLVTIKAVLLLFTGLAIMLVLIRLIIVYSMKPLVRLTDTASEIAAGDLNTPLPEMKPSDDIGRLNNAFAAMQESLRLQMQQLVDTTKAKERIESELHIARHIQMSLVPHTFSPFLECKNLELFASIHPAKEVGGDLYDFFIRDNKLFFTIGDVSGKGVPAALFMAVTRTLFRSSAAHTTSPARILSIINDTILKENDTCMFVTMFVGVLDLSTSSLTFCNAGHNPPVLISAEATRFLKVDENLPVGVIEGFDFRQQTLQLPPDCKLFIYTDGLTEAENPERLQYGESRMLEYLSSSISDTPRDTIIGIRREVESFADGTEQNDDLSMLCMTMHPSDDAASTTFSNTLAVVEELPAIIDRLASRHDIDPAICSRINLALEELLVNAVSYAYPPGVKGEITLTSRHDNESGYLIFELSDCGAPFDSTAAPEPDIGLQADERPIGGLGIHLARTLSDTMTYRRADGRNILTITFSTRNTDPS